MVRPPYPLWIALLGFAASLVFSLLIAPRIAEPMHIHADPDRFGDLAANIAAGKGFVYSSPSGTIPALDRGPVYPTMLATAFLATGGPSVVAAQVLNAIMFALVVFLVYRLGLLFLDARYAAVASACTALHPFLLWYTARVWMETCLMLVVLLFVLSLLNMLERPTLGRTCLSGLAMGVAVLTKSVLLPLVVLVPVALIVSAGKHSFARGITFAAVALLVIAPWTMRNWAVTGRFVPVQTSSGFNMVVGDVVGDSLLNHPGSTTALWVIAQRRADSILGGGSQDYFSPVNDERLLQASLAQNLGHPVEFIRRVLLNAITFWYLSESGIKSVGIAVMSLPLVIALLVTGFRRGGRPLPVLVLLGVSVYSVAAHALVVGWARYSEPILPLAILVATHLWQGRARGHSAVGAHPASADRSSGR